MTPEIVLGDWDRILRGQSSWWFVVEAIVRLALLYAMLLGALRLMGRRMSSGLSRNELLAVVSLAAAIGPAVQDPNRGLVPPLIIAAWVVGLQRLLTHFTFRSHRFENVIDGTPSTLVTDGCIDLGALRMCALPVARIHAQLRGEGLLNLGQVERLYFEPGGSFSTVRRKEERPGLSLVPEWDQALKSQQRSEAECFACRVCGALAKAARSGRCPQCNSPAAWEPAVCGRNEAS